MQTPDTRLATKEELYGFIEHLERELDVAGFFKTEDKKPGMLRNIRNLYARAALTEQEVRSLRGMVASLTRAHEQAEGREAVTTPRILLFDSGMGGLTVARAVAAQLPDAHLTYSADNAAFPYGAWKEHALTQRIIEVVGKLIERTDPHIVVVACNTASTIALAALRETYKVPFVGTVPAIKPAAAQTKSGIIGVLATPGTVSREYTHALIHTFANHCQVILHGAPRLAEICEAALRGKPLDREELRSEIEPVFRTREGQRTDTVVLGCTHYPLLLDDIRRVAPWEVSYIDPAPAIARRVADVLDETPRHEVALPVPPHGTVMLTASRGGSAESLGAYDAMGFPLPEFMEMPV